MRALTVLLLVLPAVALLVSWRSRRRARLFEQAPDLRRAGTAGPASSVEAGRRARRSAIGRSGGFPSA